MERTDTWGGRDVVLGLALPWLIVGRVVLTGLAWCAETALAIVAPEPTHAPPPPAPAPPAPTMREVARVERVRSDESPAVVLVAGVSASTRRTYVSHRRTLARLLTGRETDPGTFPWGSLTWPAVRALRGRLRDAYKPTTARSMLSTLSAVLGVAHRLGQLSRDALDEMRAEMRAT